MGFESLGEYAVGRVADSASAGDFATAWEWVQAIPPDRIAPELEAEVCYQRAKHLLDRGDWAGAEHSLQRAVQRARKPLYQRRLELLRRRAPGMDDHRWQLMGARIDPAERLPQDRHAEAGIRGIWTCGAYYSRGRPQGSPWSKVLRLAKGSTLDVTEEHQAALSLATDFFCRYLLERTDVMERVDVVVSVPAKPSQYGVRHMSLPDELAKAAERLIGLPWEMKALTWTGEEIELRRLQRWERAAAVQGAMEAGALGLGLGRAAMVVDDVTTSGSTLREAARVLLEAGVGSVYAATLCHTEG